MKLRLELLKLLEENRDCDLSGEWIGKRLGVSRNAVWKAMRSLQEDGYRIEAVRNRGYRLAPDSDALSAVGIAGAIRHPIKGLAIYLHREIDSTNNEAKRRIAAGEGGVFLTVAEGQTAGRGRQGKSFYSPEGSGIYMTLAMPTDLPFADAAWVTTAAAVAVFSAIRDTCGIETQIKWVNDLYKDGKKVCGILTEAISDLETGRIHHLVIGIGLNWRTDAFPAELSEIATSLSPAGVSRNRMIGAIVDAVFDVFRQNDGAYLDLYRRHSMVLGKDITYIQNGVKYEALALDIDEHGGLLVEHPDGSRATLSSGEISLRLA